MEHSAAWPEWEGPNWTNCCNASTPCKGFGALESDRASLYVMEAGVVSVRNGSNGPRPCYKIGALCDDFRALAASEAIDSEDLGARLAYRCMRVQRMCKGLGDQF